jgi:K+-transporting ATPase ATPase C chain
MASHIRPALTMLAAFTLLTGLAYPLLVTGVAQLAFPHQANGSLTAAGGKALGSELIGQAFDDPGLFWGRPSATTPVPYNAAAGAGRNWGPLNPALRDAVAARARALRQADPGNTQPIPVDLVTASASGLDPHISPAAAEYQVPRVARRRGLSVAQVQALVAQCTEGRQWGFLGEPRVNVLKLNLALEGRGLRPSRW